MEFARRSVCLVLVAAMLLCCLPVPAWGEQTLTVPQFFQTDYPDRIYGEGTVANNGCGITCLAMVATCLTKYPYLPDELARYFGGRAENNIARLEYASDALQLPWEKSPNWHRTLAALKEGKLAIAMMGPESLFTDGQHFIVLTGMTADGKITVNDPYQPNYDQPLLKTGLESGFDPGDILKGYSGAWLYDPQAMPEEPFLYTPEEPAAEPRYPEVSLSWEEIQLLAALIWGEARGESPEGQQAVAEVVLNRLVQKGFPDTVEAVIRQGGFGSLGVIDQAQPSQAQYDAIDRGLYGPYVLPETVVRFYNYKAEGPLWGQIGGHYFYTATEEAS